MDFWIKEWKSGDSRRLEVCFKSKGKALLLFFRQPDKKQRKLWVQGK